MMNFPGDVLSNVSRLLWFQNNQQRHYDQRTRSRSRRREANRARSYSSSPRHRWVTRGYRSDIPWKALNESTDCDRTVIRAAQNFDSHGGLRRHTGSSFSAATSLKECALRGLGAPGRRSPVSLSKRAPSTTRTSLRGKNHRLTGARIRSSQNCVRPPNVLRLTTAQKGNGQKRSARSRTVPYIRVYRREHRTSPAPLHGRARVALRWRDLCR